MCNFITWTILQLWNQATTNWSEDKVAAFCKMGKEMYNCPTKKKAKYLAYLRKQHHMLV